jgi:hypothetical protein
MINKLSAQFGLLLARRLLFDPTRNGSNFLRNVGELLHDYSYAKDSNSRQIFFDLSQFVFIIKGPSGNPRLRPSADTSLF